MNSAKQRRRLSIAVFAAVLLPGLASAQTQPAGAQQNATPQPGATANSPAASPSPEGSGASSWSAGRGSFGAQNATPGASKGAEGSTSGGAASSGSSSWVAGSGSFGWRAQPGGIWREGSGFSVTPHGKSTSKPAKGAYAPAASLNFTGLTGAFAINPIHTPPAHAAVPHASAGAHAGGGTRLGGSSGASSASRGSTLGRANTKRAATGLRSRTSTLNRSKSSIGTGTKPSGPGLTAPASPVFTTSTRNSSEGASDLETAPAVPPQ